jgi:ADP-ribose pyrophosphatase
MDEPDPIRPWPVLKSERGQSLGIFQPRWDHVQNPRNGHPMRALVLEAPQWVNVVARDEAGSFLLVRQWRFGIQAPSLEIPGGAVNRGEEPLAAGKRELLEETGCEATSWTALGSVSPNPAIHDNRCFHFLAEGVKQVAELNQDPGEDLESVWLTETELLAKITEQTLDHALVLSALARVIDLRVTDPGQGD